MTNLYLSYAIIEFFLILYSYSIFLKLSDNLGSKFEVTILKLIIYSFFVVLVTDIIWTLVEGDIIHVGLFFYSFINGISLCGVVCGCYLWYSFVEYKLNKHDNKRRKIIMSIPAIFTIIINLTSIFTKWTFYVDINGHYTYGSFAFIQTFCCYFYLVITIFNCINKAIKTKIKEERKEYMLYTTYIIFVIISRIFEDCFSMIPILYLSIFLIIQLLFLTIQNKNIFFDSLTGLNNRRKLNSYLAGKLKSVSDAHPIGIFMLDINNFKIINDNYGHLEGDKALQVVAEIISDFSTSNNAFTARYGGDEFCIILDCDFINYERTIKNLQNLFKNINLSKDETISLSIGGYFCSNNKVNAKEVLDYADKELYTNKKEWHKFN